jgi:hypothetical protein
VRAKKETRHSHAMGRKAVRISRGFRVVLSIEEIVCLQHGAFRAELESELENYACPECACHCRATIICEGVTRREKLAPWELVERPLWSNVKKILLATHELAGRERGNLKSPFCLEDGGQTHSDLCGVERQ